MAITIFVCFSCESLLEIPDFVTPLHCERHSVVSLSVRRKTAENFEVLFGGLGCAIRSSAAGLHADCTLMAAEQKQRLSPSKLNGKRADDSKSGLPFGPARRLLPHQLEAEICTFLPIADIGSLHRVSHGVSEAVDRVLSNAKALILRNELGDLHPRHRQNWVGISLAAKSCQSLRVLSAPGPISQTVETLLGLLIKRNENTLRELCLDAPASIPGVLECTFPALETFACARAVAFQHVFTRKRMPNLKRLHAGLNNFNIEGTQRCFCFFHFVL